MLKEHVLSTIVPPLINNEPLPVVPTYFTMAFVGASVSDCRDACYYLSRYQGNQNQFFVKQQQTDNQCALLALQNMFQSAALTKQDMRAACEYIFQQTGDAIHNHEKRGGDWSVGVVITTLATRGYNVRRAVSSTTERIWTGEPLAVLLNDPQFRGIIVYHSYARHFTCNRPEQFGARRILVLVDSLSGGPKRISQQEVIEQCLSPTDAWEPYIVMGEKMEYVPPLEYVPPPPELQQVPQSTQPVHQKVYLDTEKTKQQNFYDYLRSKDLEQFAPMLSNNGTDTFALFCRLKPADLAQLDIQPVPLLALLAALAEAQTCVVVRCPRRFGWGKIGYHGIEK